MTAVQGSAVRDQQETQLSLTNRATQNNQIRHGNNTYGDGSFQEVSHAIAFAQMRRAVCQR